jgi:hypothetical protein
LNRKVLAKYRRPALGAGEKARIIARSRRKIPRYFLETESARSSSNFSMR